jgi:general secretion pathway protein I
MNMRRAFTIIEVLISMAIFAMAVTVLAGGYLNVLGGYEQAKQIMTSDHDLQFVRSQVMAMTDSTSNLQGSYVNVDGVNVSWNIEAPVPNVVVPDLFAVTYTCLIDDGTKPVTTTESFWIERPTWSDPDTQSSLRTSSSALIKALPPPPNS